MILLIFVTFVTFVAYPTFGVSASAQSEAIAELLVHGNHTTPDEEILALAGLRVGDPATETRLQEAAARLRDSHRFEAVDVRRRYRSISDPSAVLVILMVDERAGGNGTRWLGPLARAQRAGMWMPVLNKRDGHALTYGARLTFLESVGSRSRISMPLTWGGERRAGLELERPFARGPLTLARASAAVHRSINPHFDVADRRVEIRLRGERLIAPWLRAGGDARVSQIRFGSGHDVHRTAGPYVRVDTRRDPSFPRNAVHVTVGWERLAFDGGSAGLVNLDGRGYLGIGGAAVLALRARAATSTAPLPAPGQFLLGGGESLRGYRAGYRAGDNLAALSAEARLPMTSPLNVGRFGVTAFVDAGTTWSSGTRLADQRFDRGVGGGIYFGAAVVTATVEVAWPETGKPRVHAGFGVTF